MPLHLGAVTNNDRDEILNWLVESARDCKDIYAEKTGEHLHFSLPLTDTISGTDIGAIVLTFKKHQKTKTVEMIDADIALKNPVDTDVRFLEKLAPSSEANEYYEADTRNGRRFQLETVNHYLLATGAEGNICRVNLSAFPFRFSAFENRQAMDVGFGFKKPVKVGNTEMVVSRLSDDFVSPGSVINLLSGKDDKDETFTLLIGKVTQVQDCSIELAGRACKILLIQMDTGLGNLTTIVNPDEFDVARLGIGSFVSMYADIKANFKLTDTYPELPVRPIKEKKPKGFWARLKGLFR